MDTDGREKWLPRLLCGGIAILLFLYSAKFFARLGVPWFFRMADSIYPNPWPVGIPVSHDYWLFPYSPMMHATLLLFFLLAFFFRRKIRRGYTSLTAGFLMSFLVEMYGVAFSTYAVSALMGQPGTLGPFAPPSSWLLFSHLIRFPSLVLGWSAGIWLIWRGWSQIHATGDALATQGIYSHIRHPQYVGLIFIALGVLVFCPTPMQLLLFVILVGMYVRLGSIEDREMEGLHGDAFRAYRARVPAYIPALGRARKQGESSNCTS